MCITDYSFNKSNLSFNLFLIMYNILEFLYLGGLKFNSKYAIFLNTMHV